MLFLKKKRRRTKKMMKTNVKVLRLGKSRRLIRDDLVDHIHLVCCFVFVVCVGGKKTRRKNSFTQSCSEKEKKRNKRNVFECFLCSII